MDKIILIGGSPTAGKSYIARKISESLKLPWISTDTIREQMRGIVKKKDFPHLFHHSGVGPHVAVKYLSKNSAKKIVKNQNNESFEVWKGVKSLIERDTEWGSFIVEGVAILPNLVKNLSIKSKEIKTIFLVDEDVDRVRKKIFTRGLWDDAHKYPHDVKEKEVEWVIEFNKYISEEAKKYGFPLIRVEDYNKLINQINALI